MGCDIHFHVEVKINGRWEHYAAPNVWRNYTLFEKLAGVRGDMSEAIAKPRGIPKDATTLTKFCYKDMGMDAHTPSWISAKEIYDIEKYAKNYWSWPPPRNSVFPQWNWEDVLHCYLLGNGFAGFYEFESDRPEGLEDLRFVFWFDN